jgi:hypothetical protein
MLGERRWSMLKKGEGEKIKMRYDKRFFFYKPQVVIICIV